MDIAGIRQALHRQPFQPFTLRLADGRSLHVPHPDFVAVGNRRIVVVSEDDTTSMIEPLLVVSIDTAPAQAKGGNDGPRRKRSSGG
jgi:hypothetical protein